ncbi:hypothetical protein C6A86_017020 [Mycobacterium sp. ITM-2016-00316]|uniref:hypothetical protein n=1 Tax=Mycobacterium sp. ITM-2016-00316 TaxID=2099695 RepID=UPI0026834785|nr:hypothetical protein [Mycobacterium sp. ITM-2016-00316]WNG79968.1 hypothetical protein C6A86_017020 [Mycobacterium sp. ITM-2016-00316]
MRSSVVQSRPGVYQMPDAVPNTGAYHYPGMDQQTAIEWFMATNDGTAIDSWHWLIEFSTTSFYLKSMNRALQAMKVSIHGPDDRHPGMDHFRFDVIRTADMEVDQRAVERSRRDGGRWLSDASLLPHHFTGQPINDHVKLITRFSTGADTFLPGAPAAGGSDWPKKKATMKGIAPVPTEGRVTQVDIYLSDNGQPYWPDEATVRETESGIGYIKNSLGWCLSAVVFNRPVDYLPEPCGDLRGDVPVNRCHRGLVAAIDENNLLWLCEKLTPWDD